ncbi:MAG: 50S ribosomal protein L6 [Chlamydiia bacterium]|nr:50S ribosomal protein L6 [Chlamydiia bacterium]
MSRIGKKIIPFPKGTEINVADGVIHVKGPKGTLKTPLLKGVSVDIQPEHIELVADESVKDISQYHGLLRALVNNMVLGVNSGFEKKLEMIGVGYRAQVQGNLLKLSIGLSHPAEEKIPDGLSVAVDKNTLITISGIDKQKVGQFAANIRSWRPPEPYQGKGIRYQGEYVRKKAGKAAGAKK